VQEEVNSVAQLVLAVLGALGLVVVAIGTLCVILIQQVKRVQMAMTELDQKTTRRDNVTDERVNLVWQVNARRAKVAAQQGTNPIVKPPERGSVVAVAEMVRPDVRRGFEALMPEIRRIYREHPSPAAFAEAMAAMHDGWIAEHICKQFNMTEGECFYAARVLAMEAEGQAHTPTLVYNPETPRASE
jgi:hypothetical protein